MNATQSEKYDNHNETDRDIFCSNLQALYIEHFSPLAAVTQSDASTSHNSSSCHAMHHKHKDTYTRQYVIHEYR